MNWKRLFGAKPPQPEMPAPFRLQTGFITDTGAQRASNEDSGAVVIPDDPRRLAGKGILMIVADGMGGHEGGEVASSMATRLVTEAYYADSSEPQKSLVHGFERANREIFALAQRDRKLTGMGTTCTAIAVVNGVAFCAHVGDSRAYLVRDRQLYRMTEDHSATMALVKQGLITMDEARTHEDRNVILRAVGTRPELEVAVWETPFSLRAGDHFLLCTDGLHDVVTDAEMCAIVAAHPPEEACAQFIKLALNRVCSDNVTVGVLRVSDSEEAEGSSLAETREVKLI